MRAALVALSIALLSGCSINLEHGPVEHFQKTVELDSKAEQAHVELKMGAGDMKVSGGSPNLMDADFDYDIPSWKPVVRYQGASFRGELFVEQPGRSGGANHATYNWNLRLNDKLPLDIVTHLGAGEAHLNFGTMTLRSVEVHMGVGQVELDLRGNPTHDYNVEIHGGIGQATVHLPSNVGIDATAKGGIGRENDRWINKAHEHAPVTIHLDVKGGIGNITLSTES
jgi:N-terminal domain of toast_rack, DUF2154